MKKTKSKLLEKAKMSGNIIKSKKMLGKDYKKTKRNKKWFKVFIIGTIPLFLAVIILVAMFYGVYKNAMQLKRDILEFSESVQSQEFRQADNDLNSAAQSLSKLQDSYEKLSFFRIIPFFNNYYLDGNAILSASENFLNSADTIIKSMEESQLDKLPSGGNTSLERFNFILQSAPDIASSSGELISELEKAGDKLNVIEPNDYPEKIFGKNLRIHIVDLKASLENASLLLSRGSELMGISPVLAGFDGDRRYLVIFQNNKELRPTGGFITAYTIANMRSGDFLIEDSSDIYDLDEKYEPKIPAPTPIIDNLQGPYLEIENLRLRDMNWNPDFPSSMRLLLSELESVGINDIDGVIALDTEVLVDIIDVIGEINVPGYGGYSNNIVELCDCEQIIYELEHFADREGPIVWSENEPGKIVEAPENYQDRKKIIGPMMNTIVENTLNLRQTKYSALFNAIMDNIKEKHILIYMVDRSEQIAVESLAASGKIIDTPIDYLHINDANLGGKKANLYVTHQVDQLIEINDEGNLVKTVELTYRNPKPQNNWLNTVLPNYVRVYVPKGSELLEYNGFDHFNEPYEELGKTVFSGRLTVRPMGVTKVILKYKLPKVAGDRYNLYLQKQPGKNYPKYIVRYGGETQEFDLDSDKEIEIYLDEK